MSEGKLQLNAKDFTKDFARSPRETLAGYVIAAQCPYLPFPATTQSC